MMVRYAVVVPVFALSIHADYQCQRSGICCSSDWDVPVEVPLYRTLTDAEVEALYVAVGEGRTSANTVVRRYLRQPQPKLAKLADLARLLRATGPLSAALRVLQE